MPNVVIEPTFALESDRLTFLSRLWGVTLTAQDVLDWAAYKLLRPAVKLPTESHHEFYERQQSWNDGRLARPSFYVLSKWDSYRLGKVKTAAEAWLDKRPTPNLQQARQAVLLQLQDKFVEQLALVNAAQDLLPLVTGAQA